MGAHGTLCHWTPLGMWAEESVAQHAATAGLLFTINAQCHGCSLALLFCCVHQAAAPALMTRCCLRLSCWRRRRLLRQLDASGIVDVGLLAPDASRGFFAACE